MSGVPRKRVLVTGATGFLGQSICDALEFRDDIYLYTLSRKELTYFNHCIVDLKNAKEVHNTIDDIKPDVILHLASNPNTKISEANPNELIMDNICGTHNLLRACAKLEKPPFVIFSSSVTVYGSFSETSKTCLNSRTNPISLYATTKLACENLLETYTMSGDIEYISVRLPALVGLRSTHGLLHDLLKKVSSDSETLDLIGAPPGSKKPYVHVEDAADLLVKIALKETPFSISDIPYSTILASNEDNLTVEEIANLVMNLLGKKKEIRWPEEAWGGDNPLINVHSDVVFRLSSRESIIKVVEEWKTLYIK